jgi:hypothetical protein
MRRCRREGHRRRCVRGGSWCRIGHGWRRRFVVDCWSRVGRRRILRRSGVRRRRREGHRSWRRVRSGSWCCIGHGWRRRFVVDCWRRVRSGSWCRIGHGWRRRFVVDCWSRVGRRRILRRSGVRRRSSVRRSSRVRRRSIAGRPVRGRCIGCCYWCRVGCRRVRRRCIACRVVLRLEQLVRRSSITNGLCLCRHRGQYV